MSTIDTIKTQTETLIAELQDVLDDSSANNLTDLVDLLIENYSTSTEETVKVYRKLEYNSPDVIYKVAEMGQARNIWSVGDKVPIVLNGTFGGLSLSQETYYAFIIGFDHNSSIEGSNTIHFQFGKLADDTDIAFVGSKYYTPTDSDSSTDYFSMNPTYSNSGGWRSCRMRSSVCSSFLNSFYSSDWTKVIKPCTKYSDNKGTSSSFGESDVTTTEDRIWLPSEYEIIGTRKFANEYEQKYQKQYEYYKNGTSTIKYKHSDTTKAVFYWTRSVSTRINNGFINIADDGGSYGGGSANLCFAFAPCFVI